MAITGKSSLSLRKKDLSNDKSIAVGFQSLVFAHKASAGDTGLDLTSLITPTEMSGAGFVNPNTTALIEAKLKFYRRNFKLRSSLRGDLIDFLAFDVATSTRINFLGFEAEEGEIFVGTLSDNPTGKWNAVDATPIVVSDVLASGETDFLVGIPFPVNANPGAQVGAVLVFVDGIQKFRNLNNDTAGPSADGNYQEVDAGAGLGIVIRFNIADVADRNVLVFNAGMAERPDGSMMAYIENLAGQLDQVIPTVAALAGVPEGDFQSAPNSVDLMAFGDKVAEIESGLEAADDRLDVLEATTATSLIPAVKVLGASAAGGGVVYSQTGSWLTFDGGPSTTGKYVYIITPGTFTVAPFVSVVPQDNGVGVLTAYIESVSTSGLIVHITSAGVALNVPVHIVAVGS